jgi:hypothetical protein
VREKLYSPNRLVDCFLLLALSEFTEIGVQASAQPCPKAWLQLWCFILFSPKNKSQAYCANVRMLLYASSHIAAFRGSWSHNTDTNEPVVGYGANNTVTDHSCFEAATFQSLTHLYTPTTVLHWPTVKMCYIKRIAD